MNLATIKKWAKVLFQGKFTTAYVAPRPVRCKYCGDPGEKIPIAIGRHFDWVYAERCGPCNNLHYASDHEDSYAAGEIANLLYASRITIPEYKKARDIFLENELAVKIRREKARLDEFHKKYNITPSKKAFISTKIRRVR